MFILTCKLGNEIINCYDGTHDKEQLKKWASKKILLCPVCGKLYEYCHGKVKTPYFRHMDKNECEDRFSESETEEHLNGKRDLFEWIKKQNGVTNAVLEGWIPETKQRPDIMFEYGDKKYVIEYQCSPIATEYVERHDLYKAVGIIDIWILGTEKYLELGMREKYIEQYSVGFYNYKLKNFIIGKYTTLNDFLNKTLARNSLKDKMLSYDKSSEYFRCNLSNLVFDTENLIMPYFFYGVTYKEAIDIHNSRKENKDNLFQIDRKIKEEKFENILKKYCRKFNDLSVTKRDTSYIGFIGTSYKISDELNEYNENILSFNLSYDSYSQLKEIYRHVKYVIDRRKYLSMINHLEKVFKNKIKGDYHVEYRNFGSGEYIDIEYTDFTIRFVIQNMSLRVSIHDPDAYMRKNYQLFEECNYSKYSEIILDVAKYANTVYDNTSKVKRALKELVSLSNKNWMFDYTVSSFNLVEIKLYPIDDENNKWESIGTLKINSSFDKNIDLSSLSETEVFEYIKNYFYKKLIRFFKIGIKSYCTSDKRLILNHKEVRE